MERSQGLSFCMGLNTRNRRRSVAAYPVVSSFPTLTVIFTADTKGIAMNNESIAEVFMEAKEERR